MLCQRRRAWESNLLKDHVLPLSLDLMATTRHVTRKSISFTSFGRRRTRVAPDHLQMQKLVLGRRQWIDGPSVIVHIIYDCNKSDGIYLFWSCE